MDLHIDVAHCSLIYKFFAFAYYSVMVLLPDKVPLPSLLVDANKLKSAISSTASTHSGADAWLPKAPLTDGQFLDLLVDQQLPGWGHEVKLRVIYLLLCR